MSTAIESVTLEVPDPTVDGLIGTALEAGATPLKPVKKSLWGYGGVVRAPDGSGSHRIVIGSGAGPFTDPDGFAWEAA